MKFSPKLRSGVQEIKIPRLLFNTNFQRKIIILFFINQFIHEILFWCAQMNHLDETCTWLRNRKLFFYYRHS